MAGIVTKYNNRTPELPGGAEQYTLPLSAKFDTKKGFGRIRRLTMNDGRINHDA